MYNVKDSLFNVYAFDPVRVPSDLVGGERGSIFVISICYRVGGVIGVASSLFIFMKFEDLTLFSFVRSVSNGELGFAPFNYSTLIRADHFELFSAK